MINIVLHEPEIPYNTGNIGRTCELTGARLHLIRPFGFILNDKMIRRAGMDYWERVDVVEHDSTEDFYRYFEEQRKLAESAAGEGDGRLPRILYATTKAAHRHTDVTYHDGDYIMFGKESAGIPEEILFKHPDDCIRIPMRDEGRSLNLSNSAAIILYEALRQIDYPELR